MPAFKSKKGNLLRNIFLLKELNLGVEFLILTDPFLKLFQLICGAIRTIKISPWCGHIFCSDFRIKWRNACNELFFFFIFYRKFINFFKIELSSWTLKGRIIVCFLALIPFVLFYIANRQYIATQWCFFFSMKKVLKKANHWKLLCILKMQNETKILLFTIYLWRREKKSGCTGWYSQNLKKKR